MNPFDGQRRLDVRAEQVVWHLVSAGVLGFVLILLLFSVAILDGADATGGAPEAQPSIARPVDEGSPSPTVLETSMQRDGSPSDVHPGRVRMDSEQVHVHSFQPKGLARIEAA